MEYKKSNNSMNLFLVFVMSVSIGALHLSFGVYSFHNSFRVLKKDKTNSSSLNNSNNNVLSQWGLDMINIEDAWTLVEGKDSVRIGIIDTGVDSDHEDLQDNLNLDYDVCFSPYYNTSMQDFSGHGTHVTGIIAATNNSFGINGVCKHASITPYRVVELPYLYEEPWNASACIQSLSDADSEDISVVNFSGSYFDYSNDFFEAFADYSGLVVCAAGNFSQDNDLYPSNSYPSTFPLDNIISVGASNEDDLPADFSNYGEATVDLFAPGEDIFSTIPSDSYDNYDGTSMAAPFVTGTIGLMKSINPNLSNYQIKSILLLTVDSSEDYEGLCVSGGRLNSYAAVKASIPTLSYGNNGSVQNLETNDFQWYRLNTSNSGSYSISSTGNLNLSASLYLDPLSNPISSASPDNGGNFSFTFNTYINNQIFYLKVMNNSNYASGSYSLNYSSAHTHHYNDHYLNAGSKHRAFCSCGASTLQSHSMTFDPNTNLLTCVLCGATQMSPFSCSSFESFIGNDSMLYSDGTIILSDFDNNEQSLCALFNN